MNLTCEALEERQVPQYSKKLIRCFNEIGNEILTQTRVVSFLKTGQIRYSFMLQMLKLERMNTTNLNRIHKVQFRPGLNILVKEKEQGE